MGHKEGTGKSMKNALGVFKKWNTELQDSEIAE